MAVKWSSSYLIGIDQIDSQHKELIDKLSELAEVSKFVANRKQFDELLNFLENYIERHFRLEEALMIKFQYSNFKNHRICHDNFRKRFENIKLVYQRTGLNMKLGVIIHRELIQWLSAHILDVDKQLGLFLSRQI